MDKTDYHGKMDALVNDKQTYEELKSNPTPALQRTTATETIGLPKLHKPGFSMRTIVSFCGSPLYQLFKYLTTIPQPLTGKSRRKLQSAEDLILTPPRPPRHLKEKSKDT